MYSRQKNVNSHEFTERHVIVSSLIKHPEDLRQSVLRLKLEDEGRIIGACSVSPLSALLGMLHPQAMARGHGVFGGDEQKRERWLRDGECSQY